MTAALSTAVSRKVVVTMQPGDDFFNCLVTAFEQYSLKNAVIVGGIGSLAKICFAYGVADNSIIRVKYKDVIVRTGTQELLSVQGFITRSEEGTLLPHIHVTFADETGFIHGGHIFDQGNEVAATMEVMLEELPDIALTRECLYTELPQMKFLIAKQSV